MQCIVILVYNLKSVGPLEFKLVAPMPDVVEEIWTPEQDTSEKSIVVFSDGCNKIQILGP